MIGKILITCIRWLFYLQKKGGVADLLPTYGIGSGIADL